MQTWAMLHFALILFIVSHAIDAALQTVYMEELCGETVDLESVEGRALLLKLDASHECHVTLMARPATQLMFALLGLNLPNCSTNLDMNGRLVNVNDVVAFNICSSSVNNTFITPGNTGVLVVSSDGGHNNDVTVLVTSFYISWGTCQPFDFLCSNKRCVSGQLECNGYDNCGDGSDCVHMFSPSHEIDTASVFPSYATIILPILFCSCFGSMAFVKYRAYKRRQTNIHLQQSRRTALQIPPQTVNPNAVGRESHSPSQPMPLHQFSNTVPPGTPAQPNYITPGPISVPQPQSIYTFPPQTHYAPPQTNQAPPQTNQAPSLSYTNTYSQEPSAPPPPYEEIPGQAPLAQPPPYEEKNLSQQYKFTKSDK